MISLITPGNTMSNVKPSQKLNARSSLKSVREKRSIVLPVPTAFTLLNRRIMPFMAAPSSDLYTGRARPKKAPLGLQRYETCWEWADRKPHFPNTASYVAQANWNPSEDVDNHAKGKPGTPLQTARLRQRSMQTGLGKNVKWARTGPSSLGCLHSTRGKLH